MNYTLDKWMAKYLNRIDLSSVPTLKINETEENTIVSVNDGHVEDLEDEFTTQIVLKGLTSDQEHCTEFGKKLYQIYDEMFAQANEYFENGMPRHLSSRELTDKEREKNIDIL